MVDFFYKTVQENGSVVGTCWMTGRRSSPALLPYVVCPQVCIGLVESQRSATELRQLNDTTFAPFLLLSDPRPLEAEAPCLLFPVITS